MRIPETIVQEIRDRADIYEVVQDFVSLKKKGSNWMACCPFHDEKTPSFSVSPAKGIYKCFGCGRGGDAVSFVMEIESISYPEALRFLAKKYNIDVPEEKELSEEDRARLSEKESVMILMNYAAQFYQEQLHQHPQGKTIGLAYFKERGFQKSSLENFGLGYSLNEWAAFTHKALKEGYTKALLEKAGLSIIKSEEKIFDRFRDRVMFPIHNISGKVIAFGARILKKDPKQAKYLNSPETPVYHKSKILYGIFQAKKKIREEDNCFLVEGYTDTISLHQAGFENTVASSGTSLTVDQIRLVRRFTENITLLYDGDKAGIKAALRGVDLILEEGLNVRIVVLPDGEDPDSYLNKVGSVAFGEYLKNQREDLITFKAKLYQEEAKQDPIKRAEMIREVVQSIVKIPDEIKRRVFFQSCSALMDIDEAILIQEGNQLLKKQGLAKGNKPSKNIQPPEDSQGNSIEQTTPIPDHPSEVVLPSTSQEKEAIRLLLNYPKHQLKNGQQFFSYFLKQLSDLPFLTPVFAQMLKEIKLDYKKGKTTDPKKFLQHENPDIQKVTVDLLAPSYQLSQRWTEKYLIEIKEEAEILEKVAQEITLRLKLYQLKKLMAENDEKLLHAKSAPEQDKCLMVGLKLENMRKEIAKALNNVYLKG